jgi:hypothetical protein
MSATHGDLGGECRCPRASEGAAPPPGVLSSNTPPPTSKVGQFTGGEDWLEWCCYVDWQTGWDQLQPRLAKAKEIAGDRKLAKLSGGDLILFGNTEAHVHPSGTSLGKKGKGQHMAYRLACSGLVILIANRKCVKGSAPNVVIRADGTQCLNHGAVGCRELGRELLKKAGAFIRREKLSRVDLCLDLPGVPMDAFLSAYREERYICRATAKGLIESSGATIYLGKNPLKLRIYDKAAQMRSECDVVKLFMMMQRRWHGVDQTQATRVEFELSRDALKSRGVDTPDDYFQKRSDLIAYLCNNWVRFTEDEVDRTNTTRIRVLPLWAEVTAGFESWAGQARGEPLEPLTRESVDVTQLLKQAVGVLLTAGVLQGKKLESREAFNAYASRNIEKILDGMNLSAETARRTVGYG